MAGEITINCGAMKAAAIPYNGAPWSQAGVDAMWKAMGYPAPAPRVPQTMLGWSPQATRGPRMLILAGIKSSVRGVTAEEAKFLNFWGKAVTDPCRKQSGISKIAGGILQIASFVVPAAGAFMFAAAEAGNAVLDASKLSRDMKEATELLTQAAVATTPPPPIVQVAQLSPPLIAPVSQLVPQPARDRVSQVTLKPGSRWTRKDWAVAAGAGLFIYLLARRIQR